MKLRWYHTLKYTVYIHQKVVDNYQKLTSQAVFVLTGLNFYWGNTDMFRLFKVFFRVFTYMYVHLFQKCQLDPVCEGLDLGAFLLTPVQRIPRYVLLLKVGFLSTSF